MKKLITLALIISATTFIQAQSNLVFNQVILLELSNGLETTVPEGKVWKVTYGQGGTIFKVNGENWTVGVLGSHKNTPIWFPAESIFTKYIGSNSINVLNILEFNVVAISSSGGGGSGGSDPGSNISSGQGSISGIDYTDGPSLTDGDGNVYQTAQINDQIWTTSNLDVSTYSDGTPIPYVSDIEEWQNLSTGAYTYAGQDSEAGYGKLYNIYAIVGKNDNDVNTPFKKLAPEGYHIPNYDEWNTLVRVYYGSGIGPGSDDDFVSQFLKSETSWNTAGNNESGLNIKNFPIIRQYQTNVANTNWNNIFSLNPTVFATSLMVGVNGLSIGIRAIEIQDFGLTYISYYSFVNDSYTPAAIYVRLLKNN